MLKIFQMFLRKNSFSEFHFPYKKNPFFFIKLNNLFNLIILLKWYPILKKNLFPKNLKNLEFMIKFRFMNNRLYTVYIIQILLI